jgi:hypothetical protein
MRNIEGGVMEGNSKPRLFVSYSCGISYEEYPYRDEKHLAELCQKFDDEYLRWYIEGNKDPQKTSYIHQRINKMLGALMVMREKG